MTNKFDLSIFDSDYYINVYRFGSICYGTNNENSDEDFICVVKEYTEPNDINIHHFTVQQFQSYLDNGDIQMLECVFLPDEFKIKETIKFETNIDKGNLRKSISTITSTSWVKGQKKLTVLGDYDKWLAIKSCFHSLRILDFGIQIAQHGKIINYKSMNYVLHDIVKISQTYDKIDLWNAIKAKYNPLYLEKGSAFRKLCPKILIDRTSTQQDLIKLFQENNCYTKEVIDARLINKIVDYINGK